jgi:hypothetical protein
MARASLMAKWKNPQREQFLSILRCSLGFQPEMCMLVFPDISPSGDKNRGDG